MNAVFWFPIADIQLSLTPPVRPRRAAGPIRSEVEAAWLLFRDRHHGLCRSAREYARLFRWGAAGHRAVANLCAKLGLRIHSDPYQKTSRFLDLSPFFPGNQSHGKSHGKDPSESRGESHGKSHGDSLFDIPDYEPVTDSKTNEIEDPRPPETSPSEPPESHGKSHGKSPGKHPGESPGKSPAIHIEERKKERRKHACRQALAAFRSIWVTPRCKSLGLAGKDLVDHWIAELGLDNFQRLWNTLRYTNAKVRSRHKFVVAAFRDALNAEGGWALDTGRATNPDMTWMTPFPDQPDPRPLYAQREEAALSRGAPEEGDLVVNTLHRMIAAVERWGDHHGQDVSPVLERLEETLAMVAEENQEALTFAEIDAMVKEADALLLGLAGELPDVCMAEIVEDVETVVTEAEDKGFFDKLCGEAIRDWTRAPRLKLLD